MGIRFVEFVQCCGKCVTNSVVASNKTRRDSWVHTEQPASGVKGKPINHVSEMWSLQFRGASG